MLCLLKNRALFAVTRLVFTSTKRINCNSGGKNNNKISNNNNSPLIDSNNNNQICVFLKKKSQSQSQLSCRVNILAENNCDNVRLENIWYYNAGKYSIYISWSYDFDVIRLLHDFVVEWKEDIPGLKEDFLGEN